MNKIVNVGRSMGIINKKKTTESFIDYVLTNHTKGKDTFIESKYGKAIVTGWIDTNKNIKFGDLDKNYEVYSDLVVLDMSKQRYEFGNKTNIVEAYRKRFKEVYPCVEWIVHINYFEETKYRKFEVNKPICYKKNGDYIGLLFFTDKVELVEITDKNEYRIKDDLQQNPYENICSIKPNVSQLKEVESTTLSNRPASVPAPIAPAPPETVPTERANSPAQESLGGGTRNYKRKKTKQKRPPRKKTHRKTHWRKTHRRKTHRRKTRRV
jgi:hypothetical protein